MQPQSWDNDKWRHLYLIEQRRRHLYQFTTYPPPTFVPVPAKEINLEYSLSTEVITGWRAWRIVKFERRGGVSELRLQAVGTSPVWVPYSPGVAYCVQTGIHEAPWPTCTCGFWAFKDRQNVEQALFTNYGGEVGKVIGQVAMWGRVLECTRGFRGEFAYPQTLQFIEVDKAIAADVATRYGVPYSVIQRSSRWECQGSFISTDWDYDRLYVTIEYQCGLVARAEVSRMFAGKAALKDFDVPPCPEHG